MSAMTEASEPRLINRVESVHDLSAQEVVDYCLQRGLDPAAVTVTGGHLKWKSPETEAEAADAARWKAQSDARHEVWERETYDRLKAKFEAVS